MAADTGTSMSACNSSAAQDSVLPLCARQLEHGVQYTDGTVVPVGRERGVGLQGGPWLRVEARWSKRFVRCPYCRQICFDVSCIAPVVSRTSRQSYRPSFSRENGFRQQRTWPSAAFSGPPFASFARRSSLPRASLAWRQHHQYGNAEAGHGLTRPSSGCPLQDFVRVGRLGVQGGRSSTNAVTSCPPSWSPAACQARLLTRAAAPYLPCRPNTLGCRFCCLPVHRPLCRMPDWT